MSMQKILHISVPFLIHISGTTNLTTFTVSLKSVDAVVVGRSEAEKNAELLARVNTKLLKEALDNHNDHHAC